MSETVKNEDSFSDVFICPISREIMQDPVVLIETGQMYDRKSITEWFKSGHNTCPMTGTFLMSQRLTPLYTIRGAIHEWASKKGIHIENLAPEAEASTSNNSKDTAEQYGPLDDPCHCLSIVTNLGVSAYDVVSLFKLVEDNVLPQSYAALVLLREMMRHIEGSQLKKMRKEINMDFLKELLNSRDLKVPAARLLVQMKGLSYLNFKYELVKKYEIVKKLIGSIKISEMMPLLLFGDLDLRCSILKILFEHAYRHRGRMMELSDAIENIGVQPCLEVIKPVVEDPASASSSVYATNGAALILASLAYRNKFRDNLAEALVPLLIRHWRTSNDPGMKYPLAKAVQYLCEVPAGRQVAHQNGVISLFCDMLPPINHDVDYSDFIFDDFFAFVTVSDTALKGLFHLSHESDARKEMIETGVISAVREMISSTQLSDDTKNKYAKKLLDALTNSPEFRSRNLNILN